MGKSKKEQKHEQEPRQQQQQEQEQEQKEEKAPFSEHTMLITRLVFPTVLYRDVVGVDFDFAMEQRSRLELTRREAALDCDGHLLAEQAILGR